MESLVSISQVIQTVGAPTHLQPTMICPASSLRGSVLELQLASGHCTARSGDYGLEFVEVLGEKGAAGTELS